MSNPPHPNTTHLLSQAITPALPTLPKPASSCPNPPKPASPPPISQNEPTPQSRLDYQFKSDEEIRQWIQSLRNQSNPPAQTRANLPKPAPTTPNEQIKPTPPSSILHPPSSPQPQPHPSLTPRQLHAARLLIAGHTVKAVAATLNVNPHTVSDWKKRPQFRLEIQRLLAKPLSKAMNPPSLLRLLILCILCVSAANPLSAASLPPPGNTISAADHQSLTDGAIALAKEIDALKLSLKDKPNLLALLPDIEIYHKAVDWPLRYHELIDVKKAKAALAHGMERAAQLKEGNAPWLTTGGVRAYLSKIDGSVQPYLLAVPKDFDPAKKHAPYRLDFFFHGRGENLTELNFISSKGEAPAPTGDHFSVQPYGRYCCANKFAGEIDTLEILDAMKKQYPIDENRVIVTGFSMGGAACWHIAVHYADLWAAASPGAGFAETRLYQNMDKNGEWAALPWYRKSLMHLYDCPDYAWNLSMLPLIAYAGEIDPQQQSGDVMQKAMEKEGLKLERIYGPKTAHKYEPGAKKELDKRLDAYAAKGRDIAPKEIHFETWTLRYNHMYWIDIAGLEKHWERARVDASMTGANSIAIKTANVASLMIDFPAPAGAFAVNAGISITIDNQKLQATTNNAKGLHAAFAKTGDTWKPIAPDAPAAASDLKKRHALQGPIDDAFLDSFMIVKPTGAAINPKLQAWTRHELEQASTQWRAIFRGIAPEKNDTDLTDADIANNNLILFGDPSSNAVLAKIADKLPIQWTAKSITLSDQTFPAADHALIMIYPNPLNPNRYVVLNSGFTFRQADHKTNSRQIAKLPDYAIVDLTTPPDDQAPGAIPAAGFFDEMWGLQKDDGQPK